MSAPDYSLLVQGSEEWQELRCGIVTGSRAKDLSAIRKDGEEKSERRDYRSELLCERLTGIPYPHFVTREMQWGLDQEPFARAAYEMKYDVLVEQIGFVQHPELERFGCSPDGLVGEDGMIQIKCPTTATHIEYLRAGTVPLEHMPQMLAEMACTGRDWVDFVSFDPRLPEHLQLFVIRYHRDDKMIAALERNVVHFNAEIDQILEALPKAPQPAARVLDWPKDDEPEF